MKKKKQIKLNNTQLLLSLFLLVPLELVAWRAGITLNGGEFFKVYEDIPMVVSLLLCTAAFIPHEWLHVAGWKYYPGTGSEVQCWTTYHLPYRASSHFSGGLTGRAFAFGTLLPFVILSVVPCVTGILCGCVYPVVFGMIHATGCTPDIVLGVISMFHADKTCVNIENETGFAVLTEEGVSA